MLTGLEADPLATIRSLQVLHIFLIGLGNILDVTIPTLPPFYKLEAKFLEADGQLKKAIEEVCSLYLFVTVDQRCGESLSLSLANHQHSSFISLFHSTTFRVLIIYRAPIAIFSFTFQYLYSVLPLLTGSMWSFTSPQTSKPVIPYYHLIQTVFLLIFYLTHILYVMCINHLPYRINHLPYRIDCLAN